MVDFVSSAVAKYPELAAKYEPFADLHARKYVRNGAAAGRSFARGNCDLTLARPQVVAPAHRRAY